jgi:putative component of membrane protein insertase Oxa1/YidC/SpoIIIJ protein YidD
MLRYFFLLSIRIYWLLPYRDAKICIFKTSCSRYVYEIAKEQGIIIGIKAFFSRRKQCRNGYLILGNGKVALLDGSIVEKDILNPQVFEGVK